MSDAQGTPRVSIFIEGSHLFFVTKHLGFQYDTKKLRDLFGKYGNVVDCIYYAAVPADGSQDGFLTHLSKTGYSVETKPLKTIKHEDGGGHQKGNFDVEIALDMVAQVENYDLAVLVSGDGDFERPLKILRSRGKQFKVVSTASMTASEIIKIAGPHFVDLATHRAQIEK